MKKTNKTMANTIFIGLVLLYKNMMTARAIKTIKEAMRVIHIMI